MTSHDFKMPQSEMREEPSVAEPVLAFAAPVAAAAAPVAAAASAANIIAGIGAVIAGGAALQGLLQAVLDSLSGIDRAISIGINNFTARDFESPNFYVYSGKIESAGLQISANKCGGVAASRTQGPIARGAVGMISYEIAGTDHRFVILYSVPFDYNLYKNWFKLTVVRNITALDDALYDDMYYDKGVLTAGAVAAADKGTATWVVGIDNTKYQLKGVMGTGGTCILNCEIRTV